MYKFEELQVWQKSLSLVKDIYHYSEEIQDRSMKDQIRRAVLSVPINIAEGSAAEGEVEFKRYLYIARKSLYEVLACLKINEYLSGTEMNVFEEKITEIAKMLFGLIKSLKK